ncbi:hypothetical protein [Microcystis phage Mel-JY34]
MFFIATAHGFLSSDQFLSYHADVRYAQPFPDFHSANECAKRLPLRGSKRYWCIIQPSVWETALPRDHTGNADDAQLARKSVDIIGRPCDD